jgi:hypothetical protein
VRRVLLPVVAPVVAFVLVGLCWVLTSPPGVGVDEPSHYIRVVGLAHGHLIGRDVPADRPLAGVTPDQLVRVNEESGAYDLPGNQREPLPCNVFQPEQPFACAQYDVVPGTAEHVSFHARYLPGAYVLPAVFARFGSSMWRTVILARLGFLAQNTVLFAVVLLALRARNGGRTFTRSPAATALLALTATPVLAFQAGTIAPSSTEILATAAFAAALGAAAVNPHRWRWIAVLCGVMASWSRDLGVVAVVVAVVAWALADPGVRAWWRRRDRADSVAVAVLAVGALGAVVWQATMKVALEPWPDSVAAEWRDLGTVPAMLHDSVGLLGWINFRLDRTVDGLWSITWLAALVVLLVRADRRVRAVVAGVAVFYVLMNLVLIDGLRGAGFEAQPRFTLPFVAVAVIVVVARDREAAAPVWAAWALSALALLVAAGQFSALLISAQRHANGLTGAPIDFDHAAWSPPGGWNAGLALMGLAVCAIVLPVVAGAVRSAQRLRRV